MWARIENGAVAEIIDFDPEGRFHPDLEWVRFDGRSRVTVGWQWDGKTLSPLPQEPASQRRAQAIDWIDATADRIRSSDRSVGQYLDAEYQLVAQALTDYRNEPSAEVPEAIQSHAAAEGLAVEEAAEQVAEAAARAENLLQAVRRIRLEGKAAIRSASDNADMMETARTYIEQLEQIREAVPKDV